MQKIVIGMAVCLLALGFVLNVSERAANTGGVRLASASELRQIVGGGCQMDGTDDTTCNGTDECIAYVYVDYTGQGKKYCKAAGSGDSGHCRCSGSTPKKCKETRSYTENECKGTYTSTQTNVDSAVNFGGESCTGK